MSSFLPTIILRHRKENLKKCSLRGLEIREDFLFYSYPQANLPRLDQYLLLTLDAPLLSAQDSERGIFLVDGTWRYAEKMTSFVFQKENIICRSLPHGCRTAYPRKQTSCIDPSRGLASIEALFLAFKILRRDTANLLDHYYWKEAFLSLNKKFF